ncbi:hypothetical protein GGR56DRAFT_680593 [Xylariaceae sp. FL0804]|nr:hypothetical protein GGR56DRAFT_680593 [Xylariaceae sp. FL0804]
MPRLEVSEFLDYLRAFNAQDYEAQHAFYSDNVELVIPDPRIGTLKGKSGIKKHYEPIHANATETVVPVIVLSDRGKVFLQMETYFRYFNAGKAVHDYDVVPGDVVKIISCAVYDLDADNKMERITCHLFSEQKLGQVSVEEGIQDSQSRAAPDLIISKV